MSAERGLNRLVLELPFPPSVNQLYNTVFARGRMFRAKTKDAAFWATQASLIARTAAGGRRFREPVTVTIVLSRPDWRTQAGAPAKKDVDNFIKATLDAVSVAMDPDDRIVWQVMARKKDGPEGCTVLMEDFSN